MPEVRGGLGFLIQKRRFNHQRVRSGDVLTDVIQPSDVADVNQFYPVNHVAQHHVRRNDSSVWQRDVFPRDQSPAFGTGVDAKFGGSFRQKRTARMLLKDTAERAAASMRNRKGADGEILYPEELACLKLHQADSNRQAFIPQHDIEQQRMNPLQRSTA